MKNGETGMKDRCIQAGMKLDSCFADMMNSNMANMKATLLQRKRLVARYEKAWADFRRELHGRRDGK
jgi:hypothetical protein